MRIGKILVLISAIFSLSCSNLVIAKEAVIIKEIANAIEVEKKHDEVLTLSEMMARSAGIDNMDEAFTIAGKAHALKVATEAVDKVNKEVEKLKSAKVVDKDVAVSLEKDVVELIAGFENLWTKEVAKEDVAASLEKSIEDLIPKLTNLRMVEVANKDVKTSLDEAVDGLLAEFNKLRTVEVAEKDITASHENAQVVGVVKGVDEDKVGKATEEGTKNIRKNPFNEAEEELSLKKLKKHSLEEAEEEPSLRS